MLNIVFRYIRFYIKRKSLILNLKKIQIIMKVDNILEPKRD